ncbi:MAG: hypothetical protein GIX03_07820 [Candidatus Eremiobacteraeota bacterium]|nr:hypothetical protein [Candidatus Eremiobacteraeota bacterium]MBC5802894.1 hypothetical protein [Candidatus Eremiobacteraeota bacterium]MBC5821165.1 hypothetical protein [Candidatus Eremiobacteraeota bacterium]
MALWGAALLGLPSTASAENGWWEPPGIAATHATQNDVLAAVAKALGSPQPIYRQRIETYVVSAPNVTSAAAREYIRGADFRVTARLAGRDHGFGRSDEFQLHHSLRDLDLSERGTARRASPTYRQRLNSRVPKRSSRSTALSEPTS